MARNCRNRLEERFKDLFSTRERKSIDDEDLRHSAVLVPLFKKEGAFHMVFIKRSQKVRHHRGEISFPGGLCEKEDSGPEKTALREAFEEIGIHPDDVEVLGMLDDIQTVSSGYRVTPVVGVIPRAHAFTINRAEVDRIVEIPISLLFCKGNGEEKPITRDGVTYTGYVYYYKGYVIWGATARILKSFFAIWTDLNL